MNSEFYIQFVELHISVIIESAIRSNLQTSTNQANAHFSRCYPEHQKGSIMQFTETYKHIWENIILITEISSLLDTDIIGQTVCHYKETGIMGYV